MLTTNNMVQENAGGNLSNEKTVKLLCKTLIINFHLNLI